jgi:hypothetical protein
MAALPRYAASPETTGFSMSGVMVTACCLSMIVPTHPLPDGQVERAVQVLVFPERIEMQYQVGLSDRQVLAELDRLGEANDAEDDPSAALLRYGQLVAERLPSRLTVRVDARVRPVALRDLRWDERHHVRFVVVCEASVSVVSRTVRIEVRDQTSPGAAVIECRRMALRGRRGAIVTESTGETALVRVPRRPMVASRLDSRHPSRRIVALCRLPGGALEPAGTTSARNLTDSADPGQSVRRAGGSPLSATSLADADAAAVREGGLDARGTDPADDEVAQSWSPGHVCFVAAGLVLLALGISLAVSMSRSRA